ncbi:hypothetical protein BS47DRAFT_1382135 [Hydnum rufescens UP504]|uniref:AB hydrolase-1 domain-containing protein n=1 Tax=Hydnum rufescens UP504 TaxID=1448309 RepID=A0A9P6DUD0_9AGAM|nr:hypothetical protein BS47DRAFT_1382135 [Hydnum rufescens UP504]
MGLLQQILPILILPLLLLAVNLTAKHVPKVHFPASPLHFKVKQQTCIQNGGRPNGDTEGTNGHSHQKKYDLTSIATFLQSRVPSLFEGYRTTWWLPSGHLQTLYVVAGDFTKADKVAYERTLIRTPDGGTLGLDMCPTTADAPDLPPDTPIIVVQHGLTGGSYEAYIRSILAPACASKSDGGLGFRAIVVNFRGCAGVPVTTPQFYSAGHTDDLRCALLYISATFPDAPLHGLGFSLGANVLTRYLGEEGENSRLQSGIVLACPWDIVKNSWSFCSFWIVKLRPFILPVSVVRLNNEFIPKTFYSKALGANLMALFHQHFETFRHLPPDDRLTPQIPTILSLKNPTMKDVEEAMIRFIGGSSPPFPFETVDAYYVWASSHHDVPKIRVPFLAINAADDPIVGFVPSEETARSLTCALAVTPSGGHLGWFHGGGWFGKPERWIRQPALEWLRAVGEDYVPDSKLGVQGRCRTIERDGFVLEMGKDLVGCRVLQQGIIVDGLTPTSTDSSAQLVTGL